MMGRKEGRRRGSFEVVEGRELGWIGVRVGG